MLDARSQPDTPPPSPKEIWLMLRTALFALARSPPARPRCRWRLPRSRSIKNIKIEHEIRVKVDKDLDQLLDKDSELF
jgi:hypothetical protein